MRQQHFSPRRGFRGGAATLSRERPPFGVVAALRGTVCPSWVVAALRGIATPVPHAQRHHDHPQPLPRRPGAPAHPRSGSIAVAKLLVTPLAMGVAHMAASPPSNRASLPPPCSARSVPPVVIVPSPISSLSLPSATLRLLFRSLSRSSSLSCSAPLRLCGDRPPSSPIPPCPYSGSRIARVVSF